VVGRKNTKVFTRSIVGETNQMLSAPKQLLEPSGQSVTEIGKEMDLVNNPPHYNQGNIECIDAIKSACVGLDGYEGYVALET
jgi:hypothetical protein